MTRRGKSQRLRKLTLAQNGEGIRIWINFPESILLNDEETVKQYTLKLLDEISLKRGILIGITEDIAPGNENKLKTVAEVLNLKNVTFT
ncbi:hypothetical protein KEJ27_05325 [Candidatus Bathyarchaeota archaeon]|nr:hypothetical protein [Candidatus Bathyarchaeota archaeon]MBS7618520.1 hypothetical protein [Candidatus Bathyarchaeota archaeon]